MEENIINQRQSNISNNELYDNGECNNQEKTEYITFYPNENSFINDRYIYNPTNEISPIKNSNQISQRDFHSLENLHQNRLNNCNRYTYNYNNINKNKYSNNSMPINAINNDNYINRKTHVNRSQEFSHCFCNNKINYNKYNRSLLYNGNTTDEGDSYINPNRDSNYYNKNMNQNKKMYLSPPVDYPTEEQQNNNSDYSNEEQLIIYPEKTYIYINEKYFNKKSSEGILKPKNAETYEVKRIEYIPDFENKYKSISLGDYILQKGGNVKLRKNKSCNNINIKKKEKDKSYNIKLLSNKKKEKRKIISSDILNSIKSLKDTYDNKKINLKQINNINSIKNNENSKEYLSLDEMGKNKGGIVDLSDRQRYTNNIINGRKYSSNEYPMWKIVASACLIQSWFRSLKRLKLTYKKNLHKIIIIQKVYKLHYKNKILSSKRKPNIYKNYKKEPNEDYNNYKIKREIKYTSNTHKQILPKYKKTIPIIYNSYSDENNYNNLRIYNKKNISNINNNYSSKEKSSKSRTYYMQNSMNYIDNKYFIAILLMEKIIENKILKIYFYCLFRIKNYNKTDIKSDSAFKHSIKLHLEPTKIKRKKNKSIENNFINKNKENEEEINNNKIILIEKEKYNFTFKQKLLLKKLFIRIWFKQAMSLKHAKRAHYKDRFKKTKNKHILLNNINKFVLEKIKQEVKRRKLIICFDIINRAKYPNLRFGFKKIKKFSKVRYNVLNNYASIIQNAFRFYLENKYKKV